MELNFVPAACFLVFRYPFGVVSKMITEEMNSGSDELTCCEQTNISSSLIAKSYTNRKMLRDLIFLVCLILAKAVLRPIVYESLLIILLFIGNKIGLLPKINKKFPLGFS